MLVLDTNHLVEIERNSAIGVKLVSRLQGQSQRFATTIVCAEEQFRGWLAQIRRHRESPKALGSYARLEGSIRFFASWDLLAWDEQSSKFFHEIQTRHRRLGTMDLKIAAVTIANNAILLSRNLRDFQQIPELKVEDWLQD